MDNKLLQKAILLARAGGREQAIPLLMHIVRVDPTNQEALDLLVDLLDESQRRTALRAFVKESSQFQSSRLILEALSTPLNEVESPDVEANPEQAVEMPTVVSPAEQALETDPFNTWISEQAMAEPETSENIPATAPDIPTEADPTVVQPAMETPVGGETESSQVENPLPTVPSFAETDFFADLRSLSGIHPEEVSGEPANEPAIPLVEEMEETPVPAADHLTSTLPVEEPSALEPAVEMIRNDRGPVVSMPLTAAARAASKEKLRKWRRQTWLIPLLIFMILAVIAAIAFILNSPYYSLEPAGIVPAVSTATQTRTPTLSSSATLAPSQTPAHTATPTLAASSTTAPTDTPAATIPPVAGQVMPAAVDGMSLVFIPPGSFVMGWKFGDPGEYPEHRVTLKSYWIDQTEVTNRMYAACVAAAACTPPANLSSYKHKDYYANPEYADFPVVYVNYEQAAGYCAWAGRRLPSEAEWEYAARGEENRLYPWGKQAPSKELANFNHLFIDTTKVGSFSDGASSYGVLDLAGNVAEWVSDWYLEDYYAISPAENPQGPTSGMVRTFRGGSFANVGEKLRASRRVHDEATYISSSLGLRCAMNAP